MIKNNDDIKQLGTILVVGAHPDDETFIAGGLIAAAIENGQRVVCVTATKGEQGIQDESRWPHHQLADIRTKELEQAMEILGVKEHHWLQYADATLVKQNQGEAVETIKKIIEQVKPDSILTFGPDGFTGHLDHISVGQWSKQAAGDIPVYEQTLCADNVNPELLQVDDKMNIFFNLDKPPIQPHAKCNICFEPGDKYWGSKYDALLAMPSQTESMTDEFNEAKLRKALAHESFTFAK